MTENTKLSISYGRRTFPDDVQAVWGARLIFPADLVWDRQDLDSHNDEAKSALIAWLNGNPEGTGAIAKMREVLNDTNKRYELGVGTSRDDAEAVLYEDETGKIIGSPQSSHGYMYVAGWLK